MDPRRLLIFRTVARLGSLSAAAADLGWTQPAVGQHMQRLERELGVPLMLRSVRGITLTSAGTTLLAHADAMAARLTAAEEELRELATLRAGSLRIAAFPSACAVLVPPMLRELAERAPDLDVRLTEVEPPEARALVLAGDADLALTFEYTEVPEAELVAVELFADELRAVVAADHRMAGRKRLALTDLAAERWVAGCPRCETHLLLLSEAAGFSPDIRHRSDDYVVVQRLVAAGLAVALLSELALEAAPTAGVVAIPIRPRPGRRVEVLFRPEMARSAAVAAALEALRGQKARVGT
ncbi:LysR family transcriptional regulator [Kribbella sp. NBC_01245]|uniref:LysR family transcriptional regulator n=1 Tax=Kribbella sp. NBC_01245 TaxID=2903578 RepID=UPI002E2B036D|nr:LysR family transcriptional regulator [Kribbella sp. NBC_01245]